MKHLRCFAIGLALISMTVLSGCQTSKGLAKDISLARGTSHSAVLRANSLGNANDIIYDGQCPRIEAVEELATHTQFSNLNDKAPHNLISMINMADIQSSCHVDENTVTMDLAIDFQGQIGPKGRSNQARPTFTYPFFIAVADAGGDVIAKEVFKAALTFHPDSDTQSYVEKMRQIIPIESKDRGARYRILTGFQLSPDQLAFNRAEIQRKLEEERQRIEAEKEALKAQKIADKEAKKAAKKRGKKQAAPPAPAPATAQIQPATRIEDANAPISLRPEDQPVPQPAPQPAQAVDAIVVPVETIEMKPPQKMEMEPVLDAPAPAPEVAPQAAPVNNPAPPLVNNAAKLTAQERAIQAAAKDINTSQFEKDAIQALERAVQENTAIKPVPIP